MRENRSGSFVKGKSPYVEIKASKSDQYEDFAKTAARKLNLGPAKGKVLSLFKLNGARVLNDSISLRKKVVPWTLGHYLSLMKKSASSVRLGVGYVMPEEVSSDSGSTSEESDEVNTKQ